MSLPVMLYLLTPSHKGAARTQQHLTPRTGTSSIGFELAWLESFFLFCVTVIFGLCLEQVLVFPPSSLVALDSTPIRCISSVVVLEAPQ